MVPAGTYSTALAEIREGETESSVVDCSGTLVGLIFPEEWNVGGLSFEISADNIDYRKLYYLDGRDVVIPVKAGGAVIIPPEIGRGIRFLRLVAGEPQTAAREFYAVLLSASGGSLPARETMPAPARHHR